MRGNGNGSREGNIRQTSALSKGANKAGGEQTGSRMYAQKLVVGQPQKVPPT